jgi:hypothetical protein
MEPVHAQFDPYSGAVSVVNSMYSAIDDGTYSFTIRMYSMEGTLLEEVLAMTLPAMNSDSVLQVSKLDLNKIASLASSNGGVIFLRLDLTNVGIDNFSPMPNTYWLSGQQDVIDWNQCNFYVCNITLGEDFSALGLLKPITSDLEYIVSSSCSGQPNSWLGSTMDNCIEVLLINHAADNVAFFVQLRLYDLSSQEIDTPLDHGFTYEPLGVIAFWDDNFVTLLPGESRVLRASSLVEVKMPHVSVEPYNRATF